LWIVLAFVAVGTVAFQLSAPPAPDTGNRFSFGRVMNELRREVRGNQSYVAPARTLTFPAGDAITDIRILGAAGPITITGSARADVEVALTVSSTGESEAAAIAIANKTEIVEDRVGGTLTLQVKFPDEERQTSRLVVQVPARLGVRLDGPRDVTIAGVRTVELANVARGTTEISNVSGAVTGEQNGGTITVKSAGAARLTLTRTRARITGLGGASSLEIRDGETEIGGGTGALEIDQRRGDIVIRDHAGTLSISGSDGRLRLAGVAREVRIDVRRADVEAELTPGVAASLITSEEPLHVSWPDPAGVRVDAVATGGAIIAGDWALEPVRAGDDQRLDHAIGARAAAAPTVSLRNSGANITLKKSSKK
jgi:hypothetical protein